MYSFFYNFRDEELYYFRSPVPLYGLQPKAQGKNGIRKNRKHFFSILGYLHRIFRQKLLRIVPKLDEILQL